VGRGTGGKDGCRAGQKGVSSTGGGEPRAFPPVGATFWNYHQIKNAKWVGGGKKTNTSYIIVKGER